MRRMPAVLGSLLLLSACSTDTIVQPEPQHFWQDTTGTIYLAFGAPTDADPFDDHLIVRRQYALSYNQVLNDPNWVAWNLNKLWYGDLNQ